MLEQHVTVSTTVERRSMYYQGVAVAVLLTIAVGFAPSYYARLSSAGNPVPLIVHVHAAVFTLWILLVITQTALVASSRTAIHRRVGMLAAVMVPVMLGLGYATAVTGARAGWNPSGGVFGDALGFMAVSVLDLLLFSGFFLAGFLYRGRPGWHKRLMMLSAMGGFLWPAITRIPGVAGQAPAMFALLTAFLLAGPIQDLRTTRRVHPVNLWGSLIVLASFPLRRAIGTSDAWHRLAEWLIS